MTSYPLRLYLIAVILLGMACCSPSGEIAPSSSQLVMSHQEEPVLTADAPGAVPMDETGQDEEINAILAQCKAARQGIESYRMHIKWKDRRFPNTLLDEALPAGQVASEGEGVWIEMGAKWRVHHTRRVDRIELLLSPPRDATTAIPPDLPQSEFQYWAAYDGADYAMRSTQHGADHLYYYTKPILDAGQVVVVGPDLHPFPLKWGFGSGSDYLDELYRKSREGETPSEWEVGHIDTGDGSKIKLTAYHSPNEKNGRFVEYLVDPERGFQVVYVAAWDKRGGMRTMEKRKSVRRLPDGRWFPSKASVRRGDLYQEWEFSDVEFNIALDASQFTIDSFDAGPSTIMHRENQDGSSTVYLYRDGQWIPGALLKESDRP